MTDPFGLEDIYAELEAEWEHTFTLGSSTFKCLYGDRAEGGKLDIGGFALECDAQVVARKSSFGSSYPAPGDRITVSGRGLVVDQVTHSADGVLVVLGCNDPNKGT